MAEEPDRLRQDIEATRASLTRDVDLLAEKTSPSQGRAAPLDHGEGEGHGQHRSARHAAGSDTRRPAVGTVQDKAAQARCDVAGEKAHDAADAVRSARRPWPARRRATRWPPASSPSASACSPPR